VFQLTETFSSGTQSRPATVAASAAIRSASALVRAAASALIRASAVSPASSSNSTSASAMPGEFRQPFGDEVSRGLDAGGVLSGVAGMEDMTTFISVVAAAAS